MNGAAREVPLVEAAEELIDDFRWMMADGAISLLDAHRHLRHLERNLTSLDQYREERQIIRRLDRRGVDSELARRELTQRWKDQERGMLVAFPGVEVQPEDAA